jgi:hypothetical protein
MSPLLPCSIFAAGVLTDSVSARSRQSAAHGWVFSHLPVKRFFQQRDFVRRQLERRVDQPVDLVLGSHDLRRQPLHLGARFGVQRFPLRPLLQRNLGLQRFLHLGAELGEGEFVEIFQPAGEVSARGGEVREEAVMEGRFLVTLGTSRIVSRLGEPSEPISTRGIKNWNWNARDKLFTQFNPPKATS